MGASTQHVENFLMILAGAAYTAFILWLGDTSVFVQAIVATLPSVPLLLLVQHHDSPRALRVSSAVMAAGVLGQLLAAIYVYVAAPRGIAAPLRYMVVYVVILTCALAITRGTWVQ